MCGRSSILPRGWEQDAPLLIHCWMGVSRSPAAALIAAFSLAPEQEDMALARRLRAASLCRRRMRGSSKSAMRCLAGAAGWSMPLRAIGRGADADGNAPFVLTVRGRFKRLTLSPAPSSPDEAFEEYVMEQQATDLYHRTPAQRSIRRARLSYNILFHPRGDHPAHRRPCDGEPHQPLGL